MARHPYHIARQEHLGDALDDLTSRGRLDWRWDYADQRAIYHVLLKGKSWATCDTRSAEHIVQAEYDQLGIRWMPVPHPGGENQRVKTIAWIEGSGT